MNLGLAGKLVGIEVGRTAAILGMCAVAMVLLGMANAPRAEAAPDLVVTVTDPLGAPVGLNEDVTLTSEDGFQVFRRVTVTNVGDQPLEKPAFRSGADPDNFFPADCWSEEPTLPCYSPSFEFSEEGWAYLDDTLPVGGSFSLNYGAYSQPDPGQVLTGSMWFETGKHAIWNEGSFDWDIANYGDPTPANNMHTLSFTTEWRQVDVGLSARRLGELNVPANVPQKWTGYVRNNGPDDYNLPAWIGSHGSGDVTVISMEVAGEACPAAPTVPEGDPGFRCGYDQGIPAGTQIPIEIWLKTAGGWGNLGLRLALGPDSPVDFGHDIYNTGAYIHAPAQEIDGSWDPLGLAYQQRAYGYCSRAVYATCDVGGVLAKPKLATKKIKMKSKKAKLQFRCPGKSACDRSRVKLVGKASFKTGKPKRKKKGKASFACKVPKLNAGARTTVNCKLGGKASKLVRQAKKVKFKATFFGQSIGRVTVRR